LRVNFTVEGILPGHYTIIFDLTFLPIWVLGNVKTAYEESPSKVFGYSNLRVGIAPSPLSSNYNF
jgi:hypothetical protein